MQNEENPVIPAQAGIHNVLISLDPRLRGGDEIRINQRFPGCSFKVLSRCAP